MSASAPDLAGRFPGVAFGYVPATDFNPWPSLSWTDGPTAATVLEALDGTHPAADLHRFYSPLPLARVALAEALGPGGRAPVTAARDGSLAWYVRGALARTDLTEPTTDPLAALLAAAADLREPLAGLDLDGGCARVQAVLASAGGPHRWRRAARAVLAPAGGTR